ncbi:MAG: PEP/pyruvate-binding domain-containing protein [Rhodoluna sp.]
MTNLGSKAENLIQLRDNYRVDVPAFLAIPFEKLFQNYPDLSESLVQSVNEFLSDQIELSTCQAHLQGLLANLSVDDASLNKLAAEIEAKGMQKVSFRTSALLEDGGTDSFAGQYQSFLDIDFSMESLREHSVRCFNSMLSDQVLSYSKLRGISHFLLGGSVIVQKMFYGNISGVLFTENGFGELQLAVSDSWQNTAVEGENAREIRIPRFGLQKAQLPSHLKRLCEDALRIEASIGRPIDVEWAVNQDSVAFLQFRPITQPMLEYSFEWDSTNISENYPGITLPLTYSVIRQFYGSVYLSFFRMLGAKEKDIAEAAPITENMLGYLDGRVYYRITNWYEAIKLMPGKRNQEYFEAMLNPVRKRGKAEQSKMDLKSILTIFRLGYLLFRSESISKKFSKEIAEKIAGFDAVNFDYINAATILESGKKIRREVLNQWAVTILNDVRLMVFHGILQRLYAKSENPKDYLVLMAGLTDKASIRPLEQLSRLGQIVEQAMGLEQVQDLSELSKTPSFTRVKQAAGEYVNEFGARTPGELKLENQRITDSLFSILELALKSSKSGIDASPSQETRQFAWPTNQSVLLRPVIGYVAKNTRRAIDWRERFRFNRAQTFNLSRKGFDAVGKALYEEGILASPRDIYWLTDHEVDELVGAHAPILDAKPLVQVRKLKFAEYEKVEKTLAVQGSGRIAGMHQVNVEAIPSEDGIAGNGVAPGEVTAEVIVVKTFDPTVDVRGKILVVHYIDPGWTLLFTQAAGIVAERGNALSHAAIIAREIGIPAIVAAVNATNNLVTGEIVTINGNTGIIKK